MFGFKFSVHTDALHSSFRIRYSRRPLERLGVFSDTSVPPTDGRDELDRWPQRRTMQHLIRKKLLRNSSASSPSPEPNWKRATALTASGSRIRPLPTTC